MSYATKVYMKFDIFFDIFWSLPRKFSKGILHSRISKINLTKNSKFTAKKHLTLSVNN